MKLLIDVSHWFDWSPRHQSSVQPGDVALASHLGPDFRLVQQLKQEPSQVEVHVPDGDIDRMVSDQAEAVHLAREGYSVTHEGGSAHGQEVTVPPRNLPLKSRNRLIADHLSQTVMPQHAPADKVTKVHVVEGYRDSDGEYEDPKRLERYLNNQLVEESGDEEELDEAPKSRSRSRRQEEE